MDAHPTGAQFFYLSLSRSCRVAPWASAVGHEPCRPVGIPDPRDQVWTVVASEAAQDLSAIPPPAYLAVDIPTPAAWFESHFLAHHFSLFAMSCSISVRFGWVPVDIPRPPVGRIRTHRDEAFPVGPR